MGTVARSVMGVLLAFGVAGCAASPAGPSATPGPGSVGAGRAPSSSSVGDRDPVDATGDGGPGRMPSLDAQSVAPALTSDAATLYLVRGITPGGTATVRVARRGPLTAQIACVGGSHLAVDLTSDSGTVRLPVTCSSVGVAAPDVQEAPVGTHPAGARLTVSVGGASGQAYVVRVQQAP